MDIARLSIERALYTWILILVCLAGGLWGFLTVGKLEDPSFSIPNALINTPYPGATAIEVEEEVTERLERAIQELEQIDIIRSVSVPGRSEIEVQIDSSYRAAEFPQIWDEVRRKVNDTQIYLPEGAGPSIINDDFGEVFGLFYAVTAIGYSAREIDEIARFLQRELLTVQGVARVETAGIEEEHIYLDIPQDRLVSLGLPVEQLLNTIQTENAVTDAGSMRVGSQQIRIMTDASPDSVQTIESIRLGRPGSSEQIYLGDVADVSRVPAELPEHIIRRDGEQAFTIAIAGISTENIIEVGRAVENHIENLQYRLPLGVEVKPIYEQHLVVDEAVNDFFINLLMAATIVIATFWVFMGWRIAVTIGSTLVLTVTGTLFFMGVFSIDMQRISLGALLIAMGMLVDNAIVVAEGMTINIKKGMDAKKAASVAARKTQWPLLGATVIGIMAFSSIAFSDDVTGEFLISLFLVILISLALSWLLAITVTPLMGYYLLRNNKEENSDDPYQGKVYRSYRNVLDKALHLRGLSIASLVALTIICAWAFRFIPQSFFPPSETPILFVNYQLPQGTDIRTTANDVQALESYILERDEVVAVTSFIGRGASRFMLTYSPEQPENSYAQLIVRTTGSDTLEDLRTYLQDALPGMFPDADIRLQRLMFGPGTGAEIEARLSGHDIETLRELAEQAKELMHTEPLLRYIRDDWRQPSLGVRPLYNEERGRQLGIQRDELAQALQFASSGVTVGQYRDGYNLLPIIARASQHERDNVALLPDRLVWSNSQQSYVPMTQLVDGFQTVNEESQVRRYQRVRTITVMADSVLDATSAQAQSAIEEHFTQLDLPVGFSLEWGGDFESSTDAQTELMKDLPISLLIMLFVSILLFGRLRQPAIIWAVVPMAICGVVIGLLLTGLPFSFTATLGMLSLSGMLMKNAIVLVDEIDNRMATEDDRYTALIDASVSRLRPVMLTAGTTSLGMLPLLWDAFFASMAVTIIGGLLFASLLTLIAVPVLYSLLFRITSATQEKTS